MQIPNSYPTPPSRLAEEEEKEEAPGGIKNSRQVDKHYFDSRIVMITGEISHTLAERVCVNLFALAQAGNDPITVIISSPGGHVESGDMIHDMIKFIKPRVRVLGSGWVASAGALIYIAADKKDRYILPNTRFLLHAPSGGVGGKVTDIGIQAKEMHADARAPQQALRRGHRPAHQENRKGHRPRFLALRHRSHRLWPRHPPDHLDGGTEIGGP